MTEFWSDGEKLAAIYFARKYWTDNHPVIENEGDDEQPSAHIAYAHFLRISAHHC